MLFNSFEYLIFLPIFYCLYWFVFNKSLRWQNIFILAGSYFFYGWWSWQFLCLLALSTLLDYFYGFSVASPNKTRARIFLFLSVINNLGVLGIFKYYNFFALQFQRGFELMGIHIDPALLNVVLPVGISFYTFHGMSYVFDIYRGLRKPASNFVEYAVFVCFFPLLVAGPIERANHLLPQVQSRRKFNYRQSVEGCRLILWGLFKKVVIADTLSPDVDKIFMNYQHNNALTLIVGAVSFSFQIYGDFSGYSDIAIGTAKILGFELLSNFRFPYFSRDIAEFWRRWHISLSSWFRDYLYIPLGGSKRGKLIAVRNTFIIFIVSGFWHGASWKYITWGFIHACGFLPLLLLSRNRKHVTNVVAQNSSLPNLKELWQMITTFIFVTVAWIFFRASGMRMAIDYIKQIFVSSIRQPSQFLHIMDYKFMLFLMLIVIVVDWQFRRDERRLVTLKSVNKYIRYALYAVSIYFVLTGIGDKISFIYFQF